MSDPNHVSELQLLALGDDELERAEAAAVTRHLARCLPCNRRHEAFCRESEALAGAFAVEAAGEPAVRRELPWVVAASLLVSLGLVVFRRALRAVGEVAAEVPVADALTLPRLGYQLLSLPDYERLGASLLYGGLLVMTLIGFALASGLVRRTRAGAGPLLLATALFSGVALVSRPAEAIELIRGESIRDCSIPADRVIEDDVVILCGETTISGTVRGDVYFLVQKMRVPGRVEGDLIGLAEDVDISGFVGRSVRTLQARIHVSGEVGHGMTAAGETLTVTPDGRVGSSVIVAGQQVEISGPLAKTLIAAAERVTLNAPVGGNVRVYATRLNLGPEAEAAGPIRFRGPREPSRDAGAPEVEWVQPEEEEEAVNPWERIPGVLLRWGMGMALAAVLLWLASGPMVGTAVIGRRPLVPILLGIPLFVGLPFAAILLAITLVGIPLAATVLVGWGFLLYCSRLVLAFVVGQAILGLASGFWQRLARVGLGLGILVLFAEIPVLGGLITLLTMFFGLGAFVLWLVRSRRGEDPGPDAEAVPAVPPTAPVPA